MNLKLQKTLAGKVVSKSRKKVKINMERYEDIKEAMTKSDIRSLIKEQNDLLRDQKAEADIQVKIKALKELCDEGIISNNDYEKGKQRLLNNI